MNKYKNILIYGIGSTKNRGCDALVNSTIFQINKDVNIVVASFDYENNKNIYPERIKKVVNHYINKENELTPADKASLEALKNKSYDYNDYERIYQKEVMKEVEKADLCIHIGGDNYCYGANNWMFAINNYAKELGKTTVLWGASLYDEITDIELINDLNNYDLLILREKLSYDALKKYVDQTKLLMAPDPAFSLKPKKAKINDWYNNKKTIGLNLSPLTIKNKENEKSVYKFIEYILDKTDYNIALIPHVTVEEVNDMKILKEIKNRYKDNNRIYLEESSYDCQEIKYVISKCFMVIAARTHASIASYSQNIPTLVIGYSVKSKGIAEMIFGKYDNYVIPTEQLKDDILIEKFNYFEKNYNLIKDNLISKTKVINKDAKTIYKSMLKKLNEINNNVCAKQKCCGCTACINVCPVKAISMKKDAYGFEYPYIATSKCINCDACKKVCPVLNARLKKNTSKVTCYAAKAKDEKIKLKSSSGGIFHFLAKQIIKEKGIVYGATIDNLKVMHIRITKKTDLDLIKGSKYAQSNLIANKIFEKVKNDLNNNKKVLFSGTPCQLVGLKKYLKKDYQNLILISVICHGVMNEKIVEKRVKELEKQYNTKINNINYKSKKNGWEVSSIEYQSDRINKVYPFLDDPLMYLYLNNLILRDSCYNCIAKGIDNNVADIILGDYWGIHNESKQMFDKNGVSAIIIRTEKGKRIFKQIKEELIVENTTFEQITKYNTSFIESANRPTERQYILSSMNNNDMNSCKNYFELKKYKSKAESLELELNNTINSKKYKLMVKLSNLLHLTKKVKRN